MKELQDLTEDKDTSGIHAALEHEGSLSTLMGWFYGPPNTPYAGGKYVIRIQLPTEYPFKPPKMKFETRIWHPNVSSQTVCAARGRCPSLAPITRLLVQNEMR